MDSFEQQISDLMYHALPDAEIPVGRIVGTAIARGRSRRRRHQLARLALGGAATAVVTLLAVAGYQTLAPNPQRPALSSTPSSVLAAAVTPIPAPNAVAAELSRLLDKSGHVTNIQLSTASDGTSVVVLHYSDGRGAAAVAAEVKPARIGASPPPQVGERGWACSTTSKPPCSLRALPDGSVLLVHQAGSPQGGAQQWTATLGRPDGATITVNEWNSTRPKSGPTDRSAPPLSIDQLATLTINLNW